MADRVVRSCHDSDGPSEQAYESVWMAHWMRTSCNKSETKACTHLSIRYEEDQQHNHDVKKHSLLRGFREVDEPKRVREINESLGQTESSKKIRKERWEGQSFPMFSIPPKTSLAKQYQRASSVHGGMPSESKSPTMLACASTDTWALEAIPTLPERQVKYHNFLEDNSLPVSKSFQDELVRPDSKIALNQFKSGSSSVPSFLCRDEEINQFNSLRATKHVTDTSKHPNSTFLVHEKNANSKLVSRRPGDSLSRQNDGVLLQHDTSTRSNQQLDFIGKNFQEMQNQSASVLFPSRSSPPELTKLEKVHCGYYSLPSLQRSVHNMETTRMCATVEESSRGPPKFSQTTHHLQFTRKTGVNLSEGGQTFGESTVSTKLKGKGFSELLHFSPEYDFPVQAGLKLLPYRSSTDSEGEEDEVKACAVNLDNESSSQTDTMDMDAFRNNLLPGVASSPSNKHVEEGQKSPTSRSAFTSAREEIGGGRPYITLPDINHELPDLAAFASSADERETSTSRTQSLDVEHLLSHAEQPTNSKSSACPDGPQGPEPSSRWVKRLKLCASNSAYGTKSSKMGEASYNENVKIFCKGNMKFGITSSQPTMGRFHGKEQMAVGQTAMLLRNGKSSSTDSARKSQNITLSHPWIRRWSHELVAPQKKSKPMVGFPTQCSKATLDEIQKKQFPSIAAMALMGKAMSGLHPCEFAKKGSFVVWNTKRF